MDSFITLKLNENECDIQIESSKPVSVPLSTIYDNRIKSIDRDIYKLMDEIKHTEAKMKQYISNADYVDCAFSVFSGVATGLADVFFVGEFSFENIAKTGRVNVEKFVEKSARLTGFNGNGVDAAISWLEKKNPMASDSALSEFGGGKQHHLRDFAHHPTFVGLAFSLLTQFTKTAYGTDTAGNFITTPITDKTLIGKNIPEKFSLGIVKWFFHLISDMAGSSQTYSSSIDKLLPGTGLPGFMVATLKEISALPIFKKNENGAKEVSVYISKLFNGTLLAKREDGTIIEIRKFDLRTELGLTLELAKMSIPVMLNECFVRGFYTIRRLIWEIKEKNIKNISNLNLIDYENIKPFHNRTIVRMLTIATGTFTAVDMAGASINATIKSGGEPSLFVANFLININYVGVGRFIFAIAGEISMEHKKNQCIAQCRDINNHITELRMIKVCYANEKAYIDIREAYKKINELSIKMEKDETSLKEEFNNFDKIKNKLKEMGF